MQNIIYGKMGEEKAKEFLKNKKFKILHMNYKNSLGEIDLIAKQKQYTVFVEVKSRSSTAFGQASEAVGEHKKHKIKQVALLFLKQNNLLDSPIRFDVIEVYESQINHIENAF